MVGNKHDRLRIIGLSQIVKNHKKYWYFICDCDCGTKFKSIYAYDIIHSKVSSCGCLRIEAITTHGLTGSQFYYAYKDILQRCYNPKDSNYKNYGGRGIKVHSCIIDLETLYNHMSQLDHFGELGYTIDRIRNNEDYCICSNNLRWANKSTQSRNQRLSKNNKTGYKGITLAPSGRYMARITHNSKTIYLGMYDDLESAYEARLDA